MNRKMAVTIVFLLFLVFLGLLGTFAVTRAVAQIVQLADHAPEYINQMNQVLLNWQNNMDSFTRNMPQEFVDKVATELTNAFDRTTTAISQQLQLSNIASVAAKIPEYLVSFLVYLIALFLFMLELPRLREKMHAGFTEATSEKVKFMNARLAYVVFWFPKSPVFSEYYHFYRLFSRAFVDISRSGSDYVTDYMDD